MDIGKAIEELKFGAVIARKAWPIVGANVRMGINSIIWGSPHHRDETYRATDQDLLADDWFVVEGA